MIPENYLPNETIWAQFAEPAGVEANVAQLVEVAKVFKESAVAIKKMSTSPSII